jgi:hypothetical protein
MSKGKKDRKVSELEMRIRKQFGYEDSEIVEGASDHFAYFIEQELDKVEKDKQLLDDIIFLLKDYIDGSKDEGAIDTLKRVLSDRQQELDKAREEGFKEGIELEQLLNAEFFEEDYQDPKRLKELKKKYNFEDNK